MAKLEHLVSGVQQIRSKLENDEVGNMSNAFDEGFAKVNKDLNKSMKALVAQANQSQNQAFSNAVQNAILSITQGQQVVLNGLNRMSLEAQKGQDGLNKNIDAAGKAGTVENKVLQAQIDKLSANLAKIPTQHPEQVKTDLSGLDKAVMAVGLAVQSIPTAKFPDMSNNFKLVEKKISDLQKKLSTRVHVFEIERDKQSELVTKIVVRIK